VGIPAIRTGKRAKAAGNLLHISSYRALNNITPSVEAQLVEKHAKCCLSVWSYFADVMLTYERYQALRAINIRIPEEPRNEATILLCLCYKVKTTPPQDLF